MKKLVKAFLLLVIVTALVLSFAACTDPVNPANPSGPTVDKIQIATAGKTEFTVGDDFSVGNLAVEEVKSDSTKRTLTASEYTVDSSSYDKTKIGTYNIVIKLKADENKTANYDVNVVLAPLTNYLEALQSALENLAEAEVPVVTLATDFGVDKRELSLMRQDGKLLYTGIEESLGLIQKNTIICVGGTVYVKVEVFGKEQLQKKSGTADDVLSELNYDRSQLNPAAMAQTSALLERNNVKSEDFTYSIKDSKHILETKIDLGGDKTNFTFKIDKDGRLVSVEWDYNLTYFTVSYEHSTNTVITAPTGTYTEVAAETPLDDMLNHNLTPEVFASSMDAYNAILAAIDNTAVIDNIRINYSVYSYDQEYGVEVEQRITFNKSYGNVSLINEKETSILGAIFQTYHEITFINETLYIHNYHSIDGYVFYDSGEYITGVTAEEFKLLFESYYATLQGLLDLNFLKNIFRQISSMQFTDIINHNNNHSISAQDSDGLIIAIVSDGGYLIGVDIDAEGDSYMLYSYSYWDTVELPDNDSMEYTDVTGQKTAAELFASINPAQN